MKYFVLFALFLYAGYAHGVSAQVVISEIAWMGTANSVSDEWIELANTGSGSVDLTGWLLKIEGKKDIALSGSVAPSGYYLIERTDDTTVPSVTADLVSSFGAGLSNDGAILGLYDASGTLVDRADGSDGWKIGGGDIKGSNATKETAQRSGSSWVTGTATPHAGNVDASAPNPAPTSSASQSSASGTAASSTGGSSSSSAGASPSSSQRSSTTMVSGTPNTRTGFVGIPLIFTADVVDGNGSALGSVQVSWAFGDGSSGSGSTITHTYYYPGDYSVVFSASQGALSATDRIEVSVVNPSLAVVTGGDAMHSFVRIENHATNDIDVSGWSVVAHDKQFSIAANTIIPQGGAIVLPSEITGLATPNGDTVTLLLPGGAPVKADARSDASLSRVATTIQTIGAPAAPSATPHESLRAPSAHMTTKLSPSVTSTTSELAASVTLADPAPGNSDSQTWWYVGILCLATLVFVGMRAFRAVPALKDTPRPEDEYEILEDNEPER